MTSVVGKARLRLIGMNPSNTAGNEVEGSATGGIEKIVAAEGKKVPPIKERCWSNSGGVCYLRQTCSWRGSAAGGDSSCTIAYSERFPLVAARGSQRKNTNGRVGTAVSDPSGRQFSAAVGKADQRSNGRRRL